MNISLENYLRDQLSQIEENHDYSVATDTVRAWIDTYNSSKEGRIAVLISNQPHPIRSIENSNIKLECPSYISFRENKSGKELRRERRKNERSLSKRK